MCLRILLAAAAYGVTAEPGLHRALGAGLIPPLWLPTGVALICLLLLGPWAAVGVAAAALVINLMRAPSIALALAVTAGNTAAPLCAYLLLRRAGFRLELERIRDTVALILLGALVSTLIGASLGVLIMLFAGTVPAGEVWQTWVVWWTGDAMGILVAVPFVPAACAAWTGRFRARRWAELALVTSATLVIAVLVTDSQYHLIFLVFPPLTWASLRFAHLGAAPCVLIVSVVAAFAEMTGEGPFSEHGAFGRVITLQAFTGAVALTGLLLAVTVIERDSARHEVERVAADLTKMAIDLESGQKTLKGMVLDLVRAQQRRGSRDP
jgi:integral membrane sensor domain MASE1